MKAKRDTSKITQQEIEFLRANYRTMTDPDLARAIGHTPAWTRSRRLELGLEKPQGGFVRCGGKANITEEESDFIYRNWQSMNDRQIGEAIGRSTWSICSFRARNGLRRCPAHWRATHRQPRRLSNEQRQQVVDTLHLPAAIAAIRIGLTADEITRERMACEADTEQPPGHFSCYAFWPAPGPARSLLQRWFSARPRNPGRELASWF